jgi:hypothetical protein
MRQTAVEWLIEQFETTEFMFHDRSSIINEAKEMERQQVIDAYQTSHISMMTAEQYYNETFKQQQDGSNTNE